MIEQGPFSKALQRKYFKQIYDLYYVQVFN